MSFAYFEALDKLDLLSYDLRHFKCFVLSKVGPKLFVGILIGCLIGVSVEGFELTNDFEKCPCVYGVNGPAKSYKTPNIKACYVMCMTIKCFAFSYAVSSVFH